ncbi:MAG: ribosome small subunit-dependent GTPase A [Anaerovoracaceae bacterium]
MRGLIIKGIGGFYYVLTDHGIIQTKGRGILKNKKITLAVGDFVNMEILDDGDGVINSIEPRRNHFLRPPIANVDCFVVVLSATKPKPNFSIIDKFLIMAEMNDTEAIVCVNKCDLVTQEEKEEILSIYGEIYDTIFVSGKTGVGLDQLENHISGKKVAFAGPSGVGKSTIINRLIPEAMMETGEVSDKTKRGKHTTRHVEIFQLESGGMIFDTPGFTSFEILEAEEDDLMEYYPDIAKYKGMCKYDNCRHLKEPECKVIEAVTQGKIHQMRYSSYVANMEEIRNKKKY